MKKALSFLLTLVMLIGIFASAIPITATAQHTGHDIRYSSASDAQHSAYCSTCGESELEDHDWVETTIIHPGETTDNTVVELPDNINFGGHQAKALIWKENRQWLFPEQIDGEDIRNDIYYRNKEIEADLGIVFDPTFKESNMGGGENAAELYNTALEAAEDWDVICCYSLYPSKMMTEGILYDLNSMDFPHTDNPWYPTDIENWEIRERLFYIANNSSIRNILASWVVYVNNTMLEDKGVSDIEETVIDMKWTFAKMKEISRNWAAEAEGNSDNHADPDNIYGLGITHRTAMQAFYHAAGFKTYELDETTGKQRQVYFDASHINLVSDFCDVIVELCNSPEVKVGPYYGATGQPQFGLKNHNAALFISALDQMGYIKDRDNYSVIPLPMKDEDQGRYYTIQNYAYDVWCVPTSTQDPMMGGIIIEAISADDYKNIAPKWWDEDFKYRYSNGDNGVKIFDLIRSSYVADFGRITNSGSPYNALSAVLMPSATDDTIANNYANQVGSNMVSDTLKLKNLYAMVDANLGGARSTSSTASTSVTLTNDSIPVLSPDTPMEILQAYECSKCGATKTEVSTTHTWEDVVEVPATHYANGMACYTCSCGFAVIVQTPRVEEHTDCTYAQYNRTHHAVICACGYSVLETHNWDNGITTSVPAETTPGVKVFTCEDCGFVRYEEIPTTEFQPNPPADDPTDDPTDDPIDEPTDEPTDDPTDDPIDEPTDEPTDDPTDDPIDEPIDEPKDDSTNKTDDKEDETTTAPADKNTDVENSGCFGVISSTAMIAIVTLGVGITVIRKKED